MPILTMMALLVQLLALNCSLVYATAKKSSPFVHYSVNSLKIGVEIKDIKLQEHLDNSALFDRIREDSHKHRLMVFRDQGEIAGEIAADVLMEMFEGFGQIYHEPFTTQTKNMVNHRKAPANAIMRISNDPEEGFKGVGTSGWHIDGAYKAIPFSHLIFNAVKAPIVGDTKFVGHREMLAAMPRKSLEFMDKIWTLNSRKVQGEKVVVTHPLVYNHPVVNDSVLCVHYMDGAIYDSGTTESALSASELLKLKKEIADGFSRDESLIYSHKWREGDLMVIDNLQLAHLASSESQLPRAQIGLRILHRLAIVGREIPTKRSPIP